MHAALAALLEEQRNSNTGIQECPGRIVLHLGTRKQPEHQIEVHKDGVSYHAGIIVTPHRQPTCFHWCRNPHLRPNMALQYAHYSNQPQWMGKNRSLSSSISEIIVQYSSLGSAQSVCCTDSNFSPCARVLPADGGHYDHAERLGDCHCLLRAAKVYFPAHERRGHAPLDDQCSLAVESWTCDHAPCDFDPRLDSGFGSCFGDCRDDLR
jgi:hypothetical protein